MNIMEIYAAAINGVFTSHFTIYTLLITSIVAFVATGPIAAVMNRNKSITDINNKFTLWALALVKDATVTDSGKAYWYFLLIVVFYLMKDGWLIMFGLSYFSMFAANKLAIDKLKNTPLIKSIIDTNK